MNNDIHKQFWYYEHIFKTKEDFDRAEKQLGIKVVYSIANLTECLPDNLNCRGMLCEKDIIETANNLRIKELEALGVKMVDDLSLNMDTNMR